MKEIKISAKPLDINYCTAYVQTSESGGVNIFIGTVRDATKGKKVQKLEFEAYERMAIKELDKIADAVKEKWPVHKIVIHHRTGVLQIGEVAVVIAVSAAHRDAAFAACRYTIDTLKETVPIWKKEVFEDGEVWVAAHP
ncbi:MAG: molybdenum cofactor biosynthesis protein MoaE [Flavipsychrobacter sp.]